MLPDGSRRSVYGSTQREALDKLTALRRAIEGGEPPPNDRITTGEYLVAWLRDTAAVSVRPSTLESYTHHVTHSIIPAIGRVPLRALTPAHVQQLVNRIAEERGKVSAVRCRSVLRIALNHAIRWGMITRNAAALATSPKVVRTPPRILDPDQARAFIAAAEGDPHAAVWYLALGMGLRRGECLGLRWSDVDFAGGRVTVTYSLQRQAGEWVLVEPKSAESRRTLRAPAFVLAALKRRRVVAAAEALAGGRPLLDSDLVFTGAGGRGPLTSWYVSHRLPVLLRAAGLPVIHFHGLRHSCATLLMSMGVHPRVVQEILGHSHVSMTLSIYSHVLPTQQDDAAARMDTLANPGRGQDGVAGDSETSEKARTTL